MNIIIASCFIVTLLITAGLLWNFLSQRRMPWNRKGLARLRLVDTLPLDPKRRLVLVTRDEVQHLLLIGGSNDIVVETGIQGHHPQRRDDHERLHAGDFPMFEPPRTLRP